MIFEDKFRFAWSPNLGWPTLVLGNFVCLLFLAAKPLTCFGKEPISRETPCSAEKNLQFGGKFLILSLHP